MINQKIQNLKNNPNYKWFVLIIVTFGTFMAALDTSIVNVSIPVIMADYGANLDEIQWVVTAYMLAFAVCIPLTSWLKDKVGHKMLYLSSLILFTIGSLLCGMSWNLPSLIVARIIQAIGGGAISPVSMSMVSEVFEPRERGKALGLWGLGVIIGPTIGPTLGGYLTMEFGWRSIFTINLPVGILGSFLAIKYLLPDKPHQDSKPKPFDLWGFIFLTTFLISFLLGLSNGESKGWSSVYIIVCTILSLLGLIGFFVTESLIKNKLIDLELFKSTVFSTTMILTAVRSIALFGGIFLLPVFLQRLKGLTEIQSGLLMLPGSLMVAMIFPIIGKISDKSNPKILAFMGLIGTFFSMYLYKDMSTSMSYWDIIFPTLIRGFGMALLMAPVMTTAMNSVPKHKSAMASTMLNLIQQISGAIGIAILSTILSNRTKFHLAAMGEKINTLSTVYYETVRNLTNYVHQFGLTKTASVAAAKAILIKHVVVCANVAGFQDTFLFATIFVILAVIPTFFLPNSTHGHSSEKDTVKKVGEEKEIIVME